MYLAAGAYLSETPSPLYRYALYALLRVYGILIHTGKGRELTREKDRGAMLQKAGRRYQNDWWLYLQSKNY